MTDQLEQPSQATDQVAAAQPAVSEPPAFVVPDAYKGKGWVEKVKSVDDLWKTVEANQKLIGARPAGIPANDAPQEEWDKFYQAARPESPDKYTLSDIDGVQPGEALTQVKASAQKLMFDAGLTPKQADTLWKAYATLEMGAATEKNGQTQEELDAKYSETLKATFGDKTGDAEKQAQEAINKYVPENLRANIIKLVDNPEAMVGVIALATEMETKHAAEMAAVRAEYGAEGKLPDGGQQVAAQDIGETVTKLAKLRLSAEAQDFTRPGHGKVMQEISELQAVVAKHYNK